MRRMSGLVGGRGYLSSLSIFFFLFLLLLLFFIEFVVVQGAQENFWFRRCSPFSRDRCGPGCCVALVDSCCSTPPHFGHHHRPLNTARTTRRTVIPLQASSTTGRLSTAGHDDLGEENNSNHHAAETETLCTHDDETTPVTTLEPILSFAASSAAASSAASSAAAAARIRSSHRLRLCKTLGVDYGLVRTGLALTTGGGAPRPLTMVQVPASLIITRRTNATATAAADGASNLTAAAAWTADQIVQWAQREQVQRIVVGWPLHKNGTIAPQTRLTWPLVQSLAAQVLSTLGPLVSVDLWDERYTSQAAAAQRGSNTPEAQSAAERYYRGTLDADAAALILATYVQEQGRGALRVQVPEPQYTQCLEQYQRQLQEQAQQRQQQEQERQARLAQWQQAQQQDRAAERQIIMMQQQQQQQQQEEEEDPSSILFVSEGSFNNKKRRKKKRGKNNKTTES